MLDSAAESGLADFRAAVRDASKATTGSRWQIPDVEAADHRLAAEVEGSCSANSTSTAASTGPERSSTADTSTRKRGRGDRSIPGQPRQTRQQAPCDHRRSGHPLAILTTGANIPDISKAVDLLDAVPPIAGRPGRPRRRFPVLLADKGYVDLRRSPGHLLRQHVAAGSAGGASGTVGARRHRSPAVRFGQGLHRPALMVSVLE